MEVLVKKPSAALDESSAWWERSVRSVLRLIDACVLGVARGLRWLSWVIAPPRLVRRVGPDDQPEEQFEFQRSSQDQQNPWRGML
jgi:hypothetical protein